MTHFEHWAAKAWPGLADWMRDGERGVSPEAIVEVVCGIPSGHYLPWSAPSDTFDDQRCIALLRAVPSIVPHLGQLSRISPQWAEAVERLRKELSAE